ncbi:TetR/AcrR family transcriptional regulator [Novosphingobium panipatense]|uniref:Transcriptional regulator, TetR family n=1 Tax=Novosphingobium panipatense TaxID=428991 RepID=A0ABY1Q6V4_9SPHN|nr:TetR/AcrR family transcriptional regulator [Novosphingobium panipatense]SMP61494.1 transcriptional regulator, TetR family [Novosphingobium panipatense]
MTKETMTDRPRAARSAARRQHLLDTARNLFVERGFHQTGIAQIAAASGIAVGQIYRDFANKEAIIAAICEAQISVWLDEGTLCAAVGAQDCEAILAWIERVSFDEPDDDDRRLMCEILAEVGRNPIIAEMNARVDARLRGSIGAALESLAPNAPAPRLSMVIDLIVAMSWGLAALRELYPDSDPQALHATMLDFLRKEVKNLSQT